MWGQYLVSSVQGRSTKIRFVCAVAPGNEQAAFAREHDLTLRPDYASVLADSAVDAVVIATTNSLHTGQVIQAVAAGKHVFVEKPVALTMASAESMFEVCDTHEVTVAAGFNWRFHPAVLDLRRMLEEQTLGVLLHVEGNYSGPSGYRRAAAHWRSSAAENPGGGMASRGVHILDLMISMFGAIKSLTARSQRRVLDVEIDDTTSALMDFQCGITGYLTTMMATAELWRLQAFGAKGWVEIRCVEHLQRFELCSCLIDGPLQTTTYAPVSIERAELDAFADAVTAKVRYPVPRAEILHGVRVFAAIADSAAHDGRREFTI